MKVPSQNMQYWKVKRDIFRIEFRKYLVWGMKRISSWQSGIETPSALPHYLDRVQTGTASKTLSVMRFTNLSNLNLNHSFLVPSHWHTALYSTYWLHFHTGAIPFNSLPYFNQNRIYQKPHQMPVGISLCSQGTVILFQWSHLSYAYLPG